MPHQCTGCGHTFADGSKEMLSGCPECGGNKFQFRPEGESLPDDPPDAEPPSPDAGTPETASSSVAETVGRATTRVRDFVASDPEAESGADPDPNASWPGEWDDRVEAPDDGADEAEVDEGTADEAGTEAADIIDADARRDGPVDEDVAQASARTDVVSEEELDGATLDGPEADAGADADTGESPEPPVESDGAVVSEPSGEEPDLAELREQLNDQFESIKILEPGQYELNLMELYDREEYIIALQENGRYVIQVPEQWMGEEPGER